MTVTHRYGTDPDQVGDLVLPIPRDGAQAGAGPHQVAVLIHGGFWRTGYDRTLMTAMADDLAQRGWASWNIEYRRGAGRSAEAVADVRAAITALSDLDAPLDLERVVLIGHSAGGHLALLSAAVAPRPVLVISLAGVCDLVAAAEEHIGSDAAAEFVAAAPSQAPAAYAAANPIGALPTGVSSLLVHGDADDRVPISQSRAYLLAAQVAGDPCQILELPGEGHFGVIDPQAPAYEAWVTRLPG